MPLKLTSLLLAGALLVAGCSRKAVISVDRAETASYTRVSGLASSTRALFTHSLSAVSDSSHRFTAVRHKLEIVSNEGDLPKAWESVINFCGSIQCEIIASSITARTPESSPSGSIALRVAPQDFPRLIAQAEKQGNIVQHTTETEDKTSAVVDTEAKIKNLNTYRDSLRRKSSPMSSQNWTAKMPSEKSWRTKRKRSLLNLISVCKDPARTGVHSRRFGMRFVSRARI